MERVCTLEQMNSLYTVCILSESIREQSLSMGETGAEGNGQGYEIFYRS